MRNFHPFDVVGENLNYLINRELVKRNLAHSKFKGILTVSVFFFNISLYVQTCANGALPLQRVDRL